MNIKWILNVIAFSLAMYSDSSFAENLECLIQSYKDNLSRAGSSAEKYDLAFEGLPVDKYYHLFIDQEEIRLHKPRYPEGLFDRKEPGYYAGMKKALAYLRETIDHPLTVSELIRLHDHAVDGVKDKSEKRPFKKGLSACSYYGFTRSLCTAEAERDWFQYSLLENFAEIGELALSSTEEWPRFEKYHLELNAEEKIEFINSTDSHLFFQKLVKGFIENPRNWTSYPHPMKYRIDSENCPVDVNLIRGKVLLTPESVHLDCFKNSYALFLREVFPHQKSYLSTLRQNAVFSTLKGETAEDLKNTAEEKLAPYFSKYDLAIRSAQNNDEALAAIASLVRAIEIFHIFPDGNQRTSVFLVLNKLLIQNGFPPVVLDDPYIFDGYFGTSELVASIYQGIRNYLELTGENVSP